MVEGCGVEGGLVLLMVGLQVGGRLRVGFRFGVEGG